MWLRTDEREDVVISLLQCVKSLQEVASEPGLWKWAILALHNALQGAMVCHLSGTAQIGALSEANAKKQWEWHDRDRKGQIKKISSGTDGCGIEVVRFATPSDQPPDEFLAAPLDLFERLYSEGKRCEAGAGQVLEVSESEKDSFRRLNNLRKTFAHFTPRGWKIELSGLPVIFTDIANVIGKISADPWTFRNLPDDRKAQIPGLLEEIAKLVRATVIQ